MAQGSGLGISTRTFKAIIGKHATSQGYVLGKSSEPATQGLVNDQKRLTPKWMLQPRDGVIQKIPGLLIIIASRTHSGIKSNNEVLCLGFRFEQCWYGMVSVSASHSSRLDGVLQFCH